MYNYQKKLTLYSNEIFSSIAVSTGSDAANSIDELFPPIQEIGVEEMNRTISTENGNRTTNSESSHRRIRFQ